MILYGFIDLGIRKNLAVQMQLAHQRRNGFATTSTNEQTLPLKVKRRRSTELLPFQRFGFEVCQELFQNCHRDFTTRSVEERTIARNVYEHQLCRQRLLLLFAKGWQTHEIAKLCSNSGGFCGDEEIEFWTLLTSCLLLSCAALAKSNDSWNFVDVARAIFRIAHCWRIPRKLGSLWITAHRAPSIGCDYRSIFVYDDKSRNTAYPEHATQLCFPLA